MRNLFLCDLVRTGQGRMRIERLSIKENANIEHPEYGTRKKNLVDPGLGMITLVQAEKWKR